MSAENSMRATGGNNYVDSSNLQGLLEKAMGQEIPEGVEQPVVVEQTVSPETVEAPEVADPVTAEAKVFELPDDARVKVKIDGKEEIVNYKDYKDSLQREAHWTKRNQTFANQKRQAEQELAQIYAQLQVQAQAIQLQQQNKQPSLVEQLQELQRVQSIKQPKPDELVAHGELQSAIQSAMEKLATQQQASQQASEQSTEQRIQAAVNKVVVAQEANRFTTAIHQVLGDKDAAILGRVVPSVEYAEAIIRHNVAQMGAQSVDQGIEFAKQFVTDWVKQVKKETLGERQAESAQKAKVQLEPSGSGSAPGPKKPATPTIFKKDGTIDWNSLGARAHAMASALEA